MENIIANNEISFNSLEKDIFSFVCIMGQIMTESIIEQEDAKLHKELKHIYENKGYAGTSIKTVYGEVEYRRHKYIRKNEDGINEIIYPLDEKLKINKIGLFSENMCDKVVEIASKNSFRETAEIIKRTTNNAISHQECWNIVQEVGKSIVNKENNIVTKMYEGKLKPTREVKVLFEEEDGVWLKMQGAKHQKIGKQELKVGVIYEGIIKDGKRRKLANKKVFAGFEDSEKFHEKREAQVRSIYNIDKIEYRLLNGDGASWIKEQFTDDKIYQLDRFHINLNITRDITFDKTVAKEIKRLLRQCEIEETLNYLKKYIDSVDNNNPFDTRASKAKELYMYLLNNRKYLVPYYKRNIKLPKPPDGITYNHMGVQENQNCTIITMRMCGRRMRWSVNGANNMAKILYTRENKELEQAVKETPIQVNFGSVLRNTIEVLSAGKVNQTLGFGNKYFDLINAHVPLREAARTNSLNAFINACF